MKTTRKTIVFHSLAAAGHINPELAIANELKQRGHRTIFFTQTPYVSAAKILSLGHEIVHCVENQKSVVVMGELMKPLMKRLSKGPLEAFKATYSSGGALDQTIEFVKKTHSLIESKLKELSPDLVIVDHTVTVPCVTSVPKKWIRVYSAFPSVLYSSFNKNYVAGIGISLKDATEEMKNTEIELKKETLEKSLELFKECTGKSWCSNIDLVPTSPFLNFYFGPQEIGLEKEEKLNPLPEVWFRLEHTLLKDSSGDFHIPDKIAGGEGKIIYFSLGTLVSCDPDIINRLLAILAKSPNKFIVSKGQMSEFVDDHVNMWGDKYVNQQAVLPKVDLFITHGGHNSIIEAFFYGVPVIVLPIFADQFDCAQRVQDCGYGFRLDAFTCSETELLSTIDRALNDDQLKNLYKKASARLQSIRYDKIAADKIEAILARSD